MKSIKLAFLFLVSHLNIGAMQHTHQSSSASLSRQPELTAEQEIKIADEICEKTKTKDSKVTKFSKLDLVNNFRRKCLNDYLAKDLSNLILEYTPISSKYYCSQTLKTGEIIHKMIQLQDGSLVSYHYSIDPKQTIKIWTLQDGQFYLSQTIDIQSWGININQLKDGSLALCSHAYQHHGEIIILKLKDKKYIYSETLQNRYPVNGLTELQDGSLIAYLNICDIQIWNLKNGNYSSKGVIKNIDRISQLTNGLLVFVLHHAHQIKIGYIDEFNELNCTQTLIGHTDWVYEIRELQNKSLVSFSNDKTIRIWSFKNGQYYCSQVLNEHTNDINTRLKLQNNDLFSSSDDKTIIHRFKDGKYEFSQTLGSDKVNRIIELQDHSLVTSVDNKIKIWALKNGQYYLFNTFERKGNIIGLIKLQDGSFACYLNNETIEIWQSELSKLNVP